MFGAHSTCVSVHRVIRICVGVPTARGDSHKPSAGLFAPPDDTDGARWLDHLRARATSADADSMPELGHGLWKPWHWPWSGRRPWTEWPSAFGRRALFSLSSTFGRTVVTRKRFARGRACRLAFSAVSNTHRTIAPVRSSTSSSDHAAAALARWHATRTGVHTRAVASRNVLESVSSVAHRPHIGRLNR